MSTEAKPKIRFLIVLLIALTAALCFGTRSYAASEIEGTYHYQYAWDVLDYLNASRKSAGASALKQDECLEKIAMQRAAELSVKFSHTRPNGTSCFTAGSTFKAENIAKGQKTAKLVNQAWSGSPSHYQNMINKNFTGVGIGCFEAPDGTLYWTECFGVYQSKAVKESDSSTVSAKGKTVKIKSLENLSGSIRIKWSKVSGVSGYYVYRKKGSGSYKKIATIKKDSTVSYKDTGPKGNTGTKYSYKVVPYTSKDGKTGSGSASSIIRVDRPTLSGVSCDSKGYVTVKWKKVSGASGYKVYVSGNSNFTSASYYIVTGANKKSVTIKNLTRGKKYYIRVCAYKKKSGKTYNSAYSSKKSIKTK